MSAFKGFETFWNHLMMTIKMWTHILVAAALGYAVALVIAARFVLRDIWETQEWADWWAGLWWNITRLQLNDSLDLLDGLLNVLAHHYTGPLAVAAVVCLPVPAGIIFGAEWYFTRRAKTAVSDKHIRGSKLAAAKAIARKITDGDLPLGDLKMPRGFETRHVLVVGKTGAGKTQALAHVLDRLRARGEKIIIYDAKGDFTSAFYNPGAGDLIFNPLDARCARWNLFGDLVALYDIESLTASLIPPQPRSDDFWTITPRQVMEGIIHYCLSNGCANNEGLYRIISLPPDQIADALRATKGAEFARAHLNDKAGNTSKNILSTLNMRSGAFRYLAGLDGDFVIRKWLTDGKPGFIYISAPPDAQETLKPVVSLFIDLAARKLLSLDDDPTRRMFFFLDEFGSLQKLPAVVALLAMARSKGGSLWLGTQDLGQIDDVYGPAQRQTIVNNCATNLIFSVGDPETARFFSEKLGDAEIEEVNESHSMGPADLRDGISLARRRTNKKIVMASELQGLGDLRAYLILPGGFDPCLTQFTYRARPVIAKKFILRPELQLDQFHGQQAQDGGGAGSPAEPRIAWD
ncbi:MAG: DUF853 family protein [Nitrospinae bacterium]|nr:DUF853 family protein [Nitrospinota bacterium]